MAKKSNCNCNKTEEDDSATYLIYDRINDEVIDFNVEFDDIEAKIADYLNDNNYNEDDYNEDGDIEIYNLVENIKIEINSKPKVCVTRT